ncbi:restriction endonuclease subunit S [Methanosphaera cuniculi]|uniref:restriction endonuclease subunit S n=1 Tax=Methanosphaera cuniculi TaxID=1077256 RepID=UPI0026EC5496|nr:restriction endonuclease subunit S [Methanosphaera cuniculi]
MNVRLMDISNIKGGKRLPKGYYLISEKNKHPYITVSDMNKGSVNLKSIKYVPEDVVKKISKYTITDKDIFISVAGTLGIIGIIPSELNGANLTENADKITDIKIDQNFLFYLLNTDIIKKLIHRTKTDNAQPKLALKEIRKLEFYYPKNTKEERKIASFLSNIDEKINLIEININLLKKYKKGLLQKLFI